MDRLLQPMTAINAILIRLHPILLRKSHPLDGWGILKKSHHLNFPMPYAPRQIVPPAVALVYRGLTIYHTYRDDELEAGALTYQFTTNLNDMDINLQFDVRELPEWIADPFQIPTTPLAQKTWSQDEDRHILKVLRSAIDDGSIPAA